MADPAGQSLRTEQRETFREWLSTSCRGTPYSPQTLGAYLDAVDSLARWMTRTGHPIGFDALTGRT